MNKKRNDKNKNINEKSINARRRIIKAIAGTSGAVVAGKTLPENWARPAIDMALLPAHAETSGVAAADVCTEICNLDVELNWNASISLFDMDLELQTPGGHRIAPKPGNGVMQGNCLQHNGDALGVSANTTHTETISNIGPGVTPGHYAIYVRNHGGQNQTVSVIVSGCWSYSVRTGIAVDPDNPTRLVSFNIPEVP